MKDKRWIFEPNDNKAHYYKLFIDAFDNTVYQCRLDELIGMDFSKYSNDSVRKLIRKTISFENEITGETYYFIPTLRYVYEEGSSFFRVRYLGNNIETVRSNELCIDDLWNPKTKYVKKYGRLNYPGETLLYTAEKYHQIAITESKVEVGNVFLIIKYRTTKQIDVTLAGIHRSNDQFTDAENKKVEQLVAGLERLFTLDICDENEHLYKLTSNLIKECYHYEGHQGGWAYPSIALGKGHNVCFHPEYARENLVIEKADICALEPDGKIKIYNSIEGY